MCFEAVDTASRSCRSSFSTVFAGEIFEMMHSSSFWKADQSALRRFIKGEGSERISFLLLGPKIVAHLRGGGAA